MTDVKQEMEWVRCPNCAGKFFRHVPQKSFFIEAQCNHCKAIYEISSTEEGGMKFKQVREPRYNHKPKDFK